MNGSKKRTYEAWDRFLDWLQREKPRLTAPRELVSEVLKTGNLQADPLLLQKKVWPDKAGGRAQAERRRHDSYRQTLVSLRRSLDQYNRLGLGNRVFPKLQADRDALRLAAGTRQGVYLDQNPHLLSCGEVMMSRFVGGGIGSRVRAGQLMSFLTGELPPLCPPRLVEGGVPDWRADRLFRRGMGEDVLCTTSEAMAHFRKNSPEWNAARAIRAQALNAVGLSRLNGRLDLPELRCPPRGTGPGLRLWKARVRALCHVAPRVSEVGGAMREGEAKLRARGMTDEARQLRAWRLHREISDLYQGGDLPGVQSIMEQLREEVGGIPADDLRPGALWLHQVHHVARIHMDPEPEGVAMEMRAMEVLCRGVGNLLRAARLESYRIHLLIRIGQEEEARPLSRLNVATRVIIRDRAGVQFALADLARMEQKRGPSAKSFAAALLAFSAGLGRTTRDYAARMTGREPRRRTSGLSGKAYHHPICRNIPHLSEHDLEMMVHPPKVVMMEL